MSVMVWALFVCQASGCEPATPVELFSDLVECRQHLPAPLSEWRDNKLYVSPYIWYTCLHKQMEVWQQ